MTLIMLFLSIFNTHMCLVSELPHALSYLSLVFQDLRFSLAAPDSSIVGWLAHADDDLLLQPKRVILQNL
jgi:hypothetical protein